MFDRRSADDSVCFSGVTIGFRCSAPPPEVTPTADGTPHTMAPNVRFSALTLRREREKRRAADSIPYECDNDARFTVVRCSLSLSHSLWAEILRRDSHPVRFFLDRQRLSALSPLRARARAYRIPHSDEIRDSRARVILHRIASREADWIYARQPREPSRSSFAVCPRKSVSRRVRVNRCTLTLDKPLQPTWRFLATFRQRVIILLCARARYYPLRGF